MTPEGTRAPEPTPNRTWKHRLGSWLGAGFLRLLRASWRVDERPERLVGRRQSERAADEPGTIYVLWHSRILLSAATQGGFGANVLVSQHGDGEYIAGAIRRLGFGTVRGSTTRGGLRALMRAAALLREGEDFALTPDGPRGPRQRVQVGCVLAAARSGAPIVPVAFEVSRARRLGSWDRFVVPGLFAKVVIRFGEPIQVPRVKGADDAEPWRAKVEEALLALTASTASELGLEPETPDVDPRAARSSGAPRPDGA